jgi:divalent metal cation (Fe/Co/Zn/Cd) transporter
VIVMPLLGIAKKKIGARLGSAAVSGEGAENILCAWTAAAVLAGLAANTGPGWWWADPAIALGLAALAAREGREAWNGGED